MAVTKVSTFEEQERFDNIWIPSWMDQGYDIESYIIKDVERYIFHTKNKDFGSLELIPYQPKTEWPINTDFPFYEFAAGQPYHQQTISTSEGTREPSPSPDWGSNGAASPSLWTAIPSVLGQLALSSRHCRTSLTAVE